MCVCVRTHMLCSMPLANSVGSLYTDTHVVLRLAHRITVLDKLVFCALHQEFMIYAFMYHRIFLFPWQPNFVFIADLIYVYIQSGELYGFSDTRSRVELVRTAAAVLAAHCKWEGPLHVFIHDPLTTVIIITSYYYI